MAEFPVQVVDKVKCEKCNFSYKSALTVFAAKDLTYESKCPQCSNVNKKKLKKETISSSVGKEKTEKDTSERVGRTRIPEVFSRPDIKGLYISVGAVLAYLLGWVAMWIFDTGNVHSFGDFLQRLSYLAFALGVVLLLFSIALKGKER